MSIHLIEQATYQTPGPAFPVVVPGSHRRAGSLGSYLRQSLAQVQPINLLRSRSYPGSPAVAEGGSGIARPDEIDGQLVHLAFSSPPLNLELSSTALKFSAEDGKITAQVPLGSGATLNIEVAGKVAAGGTEFRPEGIGLLIAATGDDAETLFVASTFTALIALGALALRIPGIGLALDNLRFDLPLKQIGGQLKTSKTAHKLIVIGKATGNCLDFPAVLDGQQLQTLTLIYRAIVDRTFDWPIASYPLRAHATRADLENLSALSQPASMAFVRENVSEELLGHRIRLGTMQVSFEQSVIKDRETFLEKIASDSGQEVQTKVIALDGHARIECADAPRLPESPWTLQQKRLIELGPQLCDLLANRYNDLAAESLAGLTEEDKSAITARPGLDEDAHLLGGED